MAGHSKWANIQHRKKAQDSKRGKVFTRVIREITIAAREAGGDPDANPRLRLAIEKANAANMPKDTVERAIKKATGTLDGVVYEELTYEGYAPGGVAILLECVTDNKNRTVSEVRHAFTKYGGSMGTDGSVSYLFSKLGIISFAPGAKEEKIMDFAIDAGADDVIKQDDGSIEVQTTQADYVNVVEALKGASLTPDDAEVTMKASMEVELTASAGAKLLKFIDALEELDDTQNVYHNADVPPEAYE
jgi:YebC/PmpR family DNA-binding regulatory protein